MATHPLPSPVVLRAEDVAVDMRALQRDLEVRVDGEVRFDPGSYHLVLANVRRTLAPGDTIDLTLTFKGAGPVQVRAEVRAQ